MRRLILRYRNRLVVLGLLELVIVGWFVWRCYELGGCETTCVPTGSVLVSTCWTVGLKVLLALVGATSVVLYTMSREQ